MPDRDAPRRTAEQVRRRHGPAPVRVATLLANGLTEGRLRAAVRAGALVRVRHGVVAVAGAPRDPTAQRARAALAGLGRDTVLGDAYAATLLHLPTPLPLAPLPAAVTVLVPGSGWRSRGVTARCSEVAPQDRVSVQGITCTSLERTALDLARGRPLAQALVVLDAALRCRVLADGASSGLAAWELAADPARTAAAAERLLAAYERLGPVRGHHRLRAVIGLADPRAETPLESASRGVLLQASIPPPDLQVRVRGDDGRWYRCDVGWRGARVLGEADGRVKYTDAQVLWQEKVRQDAILATGEWRALVRWTADDVWRTPARLLARVRRALDL